MSVKSKSAELAGLIWRLIVYFVVLVGAFWILSKAYAFAAHAIGIHFAHVATTRPAEAVGIAQARLLLAALVATAAARKLGGDPKLPILSWTPGSGKHVLEGVLWGVSGIAATLGAIAAFGSYRVSGVVTTPAAAAYYVPLWLTVALINGLAENLAIMGYPLVRTCRTFGRLPAVILVSLLFAAAHAGNPGENILGLASEFLIAALMATSIVLTGNLWLSVGIHAGLIIGEDLVFAVPDSGATYTGHLLASSLTGSDWISGGAAGPEGSVLAFPVFLLLLIAVSRVYRRGASSDR